MGITVGLSCDLCVGFRSILIRIQGGGESYLRRRNGGRGPLAMESYQRTVGGRRNTIVSSAIAFISSVSRRYLKPVVCNI